MLDFELSFYDTQPAAVIGLNGDFIAGARLDNLLSCFAGLQALFDAGPDETCVLVCTDHEEVGSASMCGADGPFLEQVLRRLLPEEDDFQRAINRSLLISADNAHAVHPNYADKHDGNHGPKLNAGPVIKVNSNQRYATSSETAGFFRHLCPKTKYRCRASSPAATWAAARPSARSPPASSACAPWTSACRPLPCIRSANSPAAVTGASGEGARRLYSSAELP